jgi:hypothetical protein
MNVSDLDRLRKDINVRRFAFWVFMSAMLTFLLGFAFVPYMLGNDNRFLYMLIHFSIPLGCVAITIPVFYSAKRLLIRGEIYKCTHPEIGESRIKEYQVFNLIYIVLELIAGITFPSILVLAILQEHSALLFIWGFLGLDTVLTTMEFLISRTFKALYNNCINNK